MGGPLRVIGWDTETERIRPGMQTPPMVCLQWCEVMPGGALAAPNVVLAGEGLWHLRGWLDDPECLLVGAETAFDVLSSVVTADTTERHLAPELGLDPSAPGEHLLSLWVKAYDANRVTDILVREKLLDLGRGCYRYERTPEGVVCGVNKYNLADIARKRAGIDIPEEHKRCSVCDNTGCPHCPWRVRYGELRGIPVAQWPDAPRDYAKTDGLATAASWVGQWRYSERLHQNFPETGGNPAFAFQSEFEEARASLWLKAMSAYGLRTDPRAVEIFEGHVREEYEQTADALVDAGLLKRSWKRDIEAIKRWLERVGLAHHFMRQEANQPPAWSFAQGCYESAGAQATNRGQHDVSLTLAHLKLGQFEHPALLEAGLTFVKETKDTKAAKAAVIQAWPEAPKSDTCTCEKRNRACKAGKCRCGKCCKPGTCPNAETKLDKDTLGLAADYLEQRGRSGLVPLEWAEEQAENLRLYGELGHLSKQLSNDIPILRRGAVEPIHTRFESILETERTSSSGPNVQNQARGGESKCLACRGKGWAGYNVPCRECPFDEKLGRGKGVIDRAGARECFVPRKGWVIIDADYSMLELHTLAQTCYWMLGHSTLGEALRQGKDPHSIVAAQILKVPYEAVVAALDKKHPLHEQWARIKAEAKNARNAGKAINFGRPGGLSAKTMRSYAVKSYGVSKTEQEWKDIIDTWNQTWTEMPDYFRSINATESYPRSGWFNISYRGVPGYRAGATYCAGCNTPYQRLGAKVAKRAGWYIFKACYLERNSPLYGARPVNFIHDQFLVEALEDRAHAAALEVQALMNRAGAELLPDVPVKTSPILCRRWSKNADEVTADGTKLKDGGVLVPWEDYRLEQVA